MGQSDITESEACQREIDKTALKTITIGESEYILVTETRHCKNEKKYKVQNGR